VQVEVALEGVDVGDHAHEAPPEGRQPVLDARRWVPSRTRASTVSDHLHPITDSTMRAAPVPARAAMRRFAFAFTDLPRKVPGSPPGTDWQRARRVRSVARARGDARRARSHAMPRRILPFALLAATAAALAADAADPVPYPEGYRSWTHVKSMVIQEGHPLHGAFGGIHHLYANELAQQGYRSGTFPDGAVIVFDLLEAQATPDHALVEGPRKVAGVMHRDAGRYAATGGWGFEGFKGDSKTERAVGPDPAAAKGACFDCHLQRKDHAYVFSAWRD
jgi:hypothetical protein